jgi:exonuclease 1
MEAGRLDPRCVQVSAKYVSGRCHELLTKFGVAKVILVMDGKRCPLKSDTNQERERRRQENLDEARSYKRHGRHDKAEEKYKSCIKIRDDLTDAVLQTVERNFGRDGRVELVWSPYEADAQLVRLCIERQADAVVTEVR